MKVFERLNKDVVQWLKDIPVDRWSRSAFDTVYKNQAVTSNMCEQFNGTILEYMVCETFWERTGFDLVQSPIIKRKLGKPRTKRKKASEKDTNPYKMKIKLGHHRCSRCKQFGHMKTSCKANLGSLTDAIEEARPPDVPGDGDSVAASDGANDA
ncbi:hypothetical protein CRG98_008859 [Punica granatum]|uniref:CCHC-type domain-containing protein n=1 Tax=Punica granatum TaxID=22663 RepID=A0A2I0KS08_PUNGR|nr:hypothetical protein CRG98_008859 [Punica granatum]